MRYPDMKHSAKRTTALALALLMLLSAFASCSESEVNTPETTWVQILMEEHLLETMVVSYC